MKTLKRLLILPILIAVIGLQAQAPENWFNLDPVKDGVFGIGTEKAYSELLKGKESKQVVVAVLDSGIDIEHEDLKDIIWTNTKEIAGNGKDDDKNGYIDDIHGWNFIGGKDGSHVDKDTYEITRLYKKLNDKYKGVSETEVSRKNMKEFELYLDVKNKFEGTLKDLKATKAEIQNIGAAIMMAIQTVQEHLKKDTFTMEDIIDIDVAEDENLAQAKTLVSILYLNSTDPVNAADEIERELNNIDDQLNFSYNPEFNPRTIVGDDYENSKERGYGNPDVKGPDAFHGTHVAGIIGAIRGNNTGMDGVADNVKIMVVRTVPNGDERDKDVANAIRYAVDNGADIVNMSFGKSYVYDKKTIDKAIRYAEKKGVLLVHAAGNDGKNTDVEDIFPTPFYSRPKNKRAKNWIEVGASGWTGDENTPAPFSNYGKNRVDLFAPGMSIYSTVPGSKYSKSDGTSMASPVVAGAAALILSYYPTLSAQQLKVILTSSVTNMSEEEVVPPGATSPSQSTTFSELSNSGGILNVYNALKLAETTKGKRKKRR